MKSFVSKIAQGSIIYLFCSVIAGNIVEAGTAAANTFEEVNKGLLTFFEDRRSSDGNLEEIGSGFFEYTSEPFEGTFYLEDEGSYSGYYSSGAVPSYPGDRVYIDSSEDYRIITNINIDIFGTIIDRRYKESWVSGDRFGTILLFDPNENEIFSPINSNDESLEIREITVIRNRYGNDGLRDIPSWIFEENLVTGEEFRINGNGTFNIYDAGDDGSYFYDPSFDIDGQEDTDTTIQGIWTAEAVPEPLTILGVGTALAFGTGFKRKLATSVKKSKNYVIS